MNQVRCGGSLGINQVNEVGKGYAKALWQKCRRSFGDSINYKWRLHWEEKIMRQSRGMSGGPEHGGHWSPLVSEEVSKFPERSGRVLHAIVRTWLFLEWDGSHWWVLHRGATESDLSSNRKEVPLISAPWLPRFSQAMKQAEVYIAVLPWGISKMRISAPHPKLRWGH